MKCLICQNKSFECIHNGTRDVPDIRVMKCTKCGMVQLDNQEYNTDQNYSGGGMMENSYSSITDKTEQHLPWDVWIAETERDDNRRYRELIEVCKGKHVLEFGCGNGGFLRRIKSVAASVTGIELMDEARENINKEGITTYKTLEETDKKYDIACMFMVIEHLNYPDGYLKKIYDVLNKDGLLIVETVNAQDALISKYKCEAFEDFTYWSEHVFLYNSDTIEKLLNRNGFKTKWNTQIQRYSLGNHLYWLSNGKPGGHVKWMEFSEPEVSDAYAQKLIQLKLADTLWYGGVKAY